MDPSGSGSGIEIITFFTWTVYDHRVYPRLVVWTCWSSRTGTSAASCWTAIISTSRSMTTSIWSAHRWEPQCCGSGMFIPGPGSDFFSFRIPDPQHWWKQRILLTCTCPPRWGLSRTVVIVGLVILVVLLHGLSRIMRWPPFKRRCLVITD